MLKYQVEVHVTFRQVIHEHCMVVVTVEAESEEQARAMVKEADE